MRVFYSNKLEVKMAIDREDGRHKFKVYIPWNVKPPALMEVIVIVLCNTGLACVARVVFIGSECRKSTGLTYILAVQIKWRYEHELAMLESVESGE